MRRFGVQGGIACVTVAVVAAVVLGARGAASGALGPTAFADGKWTMLYDAALRSTHSRAGSTAHANSYLAGTGTFEVNGGNVAGTFEGSGSVAGTSQTTSAAGAGVLALGASGNVGGIASAPVLDGSVRVTGNVHVVVGNVAVDAPVDVSGPMGGDGPATLTILHASCSHVTGDWTMGLRSSAGANGVDVQGPASFDAYRISGPRDLFAYANEIERLYRDTSRFEATVTAGHVDLAQLAVLLERAENLLSDLPAFAMCDDEDAAGGYAVTIADQLDRIMKVLIAHPEQLDTTTLIELFTDASRVGLTGGWSSDGDTLQAKFETALGAQLDTAIAGHDTDTILEIDTAATEYGWTDLAARAGAAL